MKIQFFLSMLPPTVTHQEKKIGVRSGKPYVYEDSRLKYAREKLCAALAPHKPDKPMTGPLRLMTKWCFPPSPTAKAPESPVYKTTKPDTDNLIKLLKDCMTSCGFWHDDAQVASEITEKFIIPDKTMSGIYVRLELKHSAHCTALPERGSGCCFKNRHMYRQLERLRRLFGGICSISLYLATVRRAR